MACGKEMIGLSIAEGLSLCVVLLLAMYGTVQGTMALVGALLRPRQPQVLLVISPRGTEDLEQQIRYAAKLAAQCRIPLSVDCSDLDENGERALGLLMREKCINEVLR